MGFVKCSCFPDLLTAFASKLSKGLNRVCKRMTSKNYESSLTPALLCSADTSERQIFAFTGRLHERSLTFVQEYEIHGGKCKFFCKYLQQSLTQPNLVLNGYARVIAGTT